MFSVRSCLRLLSLSVSFNRGRALSLHSSPTHAFLHQLSHVEWSWPPCCPVKHCFLSCVVCFCCHWIIVPQTIATTHVSVSAFLCVQAVLLDAVRDHLIQQGDASAKDAANKNLVPLTNGVAAYMDQHFGKQVCEDRPTLTTTERRVQRIDCSKQALLEVSADSCVCRQCGKWLTSYIVGTTCRLDITQQCELCDAACGQAAGQASLCLFCLFCVSRHSVAFIFFLYLSFHCSFFVFSLPGLFPK